MKEYRIQAETMSTAEFHVYANSKEEALEKAEEKMEEALEGEWCVDSRTLLEYTLQEMYCDE